MFPVGSLPVLAPRPSPSGGGQASSKRDGQLQAGGLNALENGVSKLQAVKACDACRKRKIRCAPVTARGKDGEAVITCAHCIGHGRPECSYTEPRAGASGKRSDGKTSVEKLEERVRVLESMLEARQAAPSSPVASTSTASASLRWPSSLSQLPHDPSIDLLVEDLNAICIETSTFVGEESRLHLESTCYSALPSKAACGSGFVSDSPIDLRRTAMEKEAHSGAFLPLPPPDLAKLLLDAFWLEYNPMLDLVHRPYFEACLERGMLVVDPSFRRLYLTMCAMGSRGVRDPRLKLGDADWSWGEEFFTLASSPVHSSPTLCDLQADALSTFFLLGNSGWPTVWHATRDAVRKLIDAGVHRERTPFWNASVLRDQLRKRAFSMLYGLDRVTSSALGRPLALHDGDFDVKPPLNISEADLSALALAEREAVLQGRPRPDLPDHQLAGGQLVLDIMRLEGRIIELLPRIKALSPDEVREAVLEISAGLDRAQVGKPLLTRWDPVWQADGILVQTYMTTSFINTARVLLYQPFFAGSSPVDPQSPLGIATTAAREVAYGTEAIADRGLLNMTLWFAPMLAHTASLVLVTAAVFRLRDAPDDLLQDILLDIERCLKGLRAWAKLSFLAHEYHQSLLHHSGQLRSRMRKHGVDPSSAEDGPATKRGKVPPPPIATALPPAEGSGARRSRFTDSVSSPSGIIMTDYTQATNAFSAHNPLDPFMSLPLDPQASMFDTALLHTFDWEHV